MSQLNYSIDIAAVAYPGQLVDNSPKDILSAIATEAIPYGVAVADAGSGSEYGKLLGALPTADSDILLGISVADQNRAQDPSVASPQYRDKEAVGLMRQGRVYVKLGANSGSSAVGGQVYVVHDATAVGDELGELTTVDDATTVALPGAKFLSIAAAGEFAVVELDLA